MTLGTHVAFASVLYLGGATLFGYKPDWRRWLLAGVSVPGGRASQSRRVIHEPAGWLLARRKFV